MKVKELKILENYLIVIEPKEKLSLMEALEKFVLSKEKTDKKIGFAWVSMIGGGLEKTDCVFSVGYNVGYKEKEKKDYPTLECNITLGCIAWDSEDINKPMVHLYGDFIDEKLEKSSGGHLVDVGEIGLTMEIRLDVASREKLTRDLHPLVKVKLLNPPVYSFDNPGQTGKSDDHGGNQTGQKEEVEKLRKELEEMKKKKPRFA